MKGALRKPDSTTCLSSLWVPKKTSCSPDNRGGARGGRSGKSKSSNQLKG